jgi:hypothetical protein
VSGSDGKTSFFLDLDIKEFTEKGLHAKGIIEGIGDAQNMVGLVEGLMGATKALAAIGLVAYSLKTTFDLVFEAEQIKQVNNQFELLAKNVGLVAHALKDDLLKATKGLADDTDVLQAANRALVTMGDEARRLPEIMELARRVAQNFGGDVVERFESINNAIAAGSARALRQHGIMIDVDKAVRQYARSLGVSSDMLTESGRRQAILNAALEYGKRNILEVEGAEAKALTTAKQLMVTIKQLGEVFVIAFEKLAGPAVRSVLRYLAETAKEATNFIVAHLGTGLEQTAAKIHEAEKKAAAFRREIENLQKNQGVMGYLSNVFGITERNLAKLRAGLADTEAEIKRLREEERKEKAKQEAKTPKGAGGGSSDVEQKMIDQEKLHQQRLRLRAEILALQEHDARQRVEMAASEEELAQAQGDRRLAMEKEWQLKREEEQRLANESSGEIKRLHLEKMSELDTEYYNRLRELEMQQADERERMLERSVRASATFYDGMSRSSQLWAAQQIANYKKVGGAGGVTFNAMMKHGMQAAEMMGKAFVDHSMSASEIMKSMFLNTIADIAQASGVYHVAEGIASYDYAQVAAGFGLIALSGAIRALAGGGGGGSSMSADYGGGGGGGYSAGGGYENQGQLMEPQEAKKSVTIQVMGHYFETEQTKTKLMDMIRETTDATDFKYVQIGHT